MASKKKKKGINVVMRFIYFGVFLYAAISLVQIGYEYYSNNQVLADIQETYNEEVIISDEGSILRKSFEPLHEINEDIVGWISIDDTKINYPILHTTDNEFYLTNNYKKNKNKAGSIFMDYRNDILWYNKHTILYGHRMKDGSMFSHVKKYQDQDFYDEHPTFQYDTLTDSYEVEVFAAYITTTDFNYIQTDFDQPEDFMDLVADMGFRSLIDTNVRVSEDDQIITLSTCDYFYDKGRFVVHGILRNKNVE